MFTYFLQASVPCLSMLTYLNISLHTFYVFEEVRWGVRMWATCVGGIKQTYDVGNVIKGSEKGFFHFGGSMTMIFFEKGKIIFSEDLLENGKVGREVYGRMGDHCARAL